MKHRTVFPVKKKRADTLSAEQKAEQFIAQLKRNKEIIRRKLGRIRSHVVPGTFTLAVDKPSSEVTSDILVYAVGLVINSKILSDIYKVEVVENLITLNQWLMEKSGCPGYHYPLSEVQFAPYIEWVIENGLDKYPGWSIHR